MHSATAVTEVVAHMHPATAVASCAWPFDTWRSAVVTATAATANPPTTTDNAGDPAQDWATSVTADSLQTNLTGRSTAQNPENQWAAAQAPGSPADVSR